MAEFDGSERLDIAVSEQGISAVVRKTNQVAAAAQKLSPEAALSLRGEALRLGQHLESQVKSAAKVALEVAVKSTPHLSGLARANWTVKVNMTRPASYPTQETDYDGDKTILEGTMEIDAADRQPGSIYWISNSAHHITALERGHSAQAPHGMTQLAKQAAEAHVRDLNNRDKRKKV